MGSQPPWRVQTPSVVSVGGTERWGGWGTNKEGSERAPRALPTVNSTSIGKGRTRG